MEINLKIIKELLKNRIKTSADLESFKRKTAKKYKISQPNNINLLKGYHKLLEKKSEKKPNPLIEKLLKTRPIRSLSGIANISVLTKPYPCPGKCIYCPKEKGIPKSYLSGEPAVERAKNLKFDPYLQVQKRIEMLENQGHPTDKIELRIIGGSWSAYPKIYQTWFIKRCFEATNDYKNSKFKIQNEKLQFKIKKLEETQKLNEKTKHRIVGISIETRPDLINEREIKNLRMLGVTMVELGVQTVFDDILKKCHRGHTIKETIKASKLLKDAGFKVMYQMMPNLPGANLKRDLECFKTIFKNPDFKPDWLKIYPCLVCKGSELYQIWRDKKYRPYSDKELISLLIKIKKIIPDFVRVARIIRDIPAQKVKAGSKISNLREVVLKEMKNKGEMCQCVRCREIKGDYDPKEKVYLFREDYEASEGKEIFLSIEAERRGTTTQKNAERKLYALLRLRISSYVFKKEKFLLPVLQESAIIRELHTYGEAVPLGEKKLAPQHRGLGKKLIKEAEKIIQNEFGLTKIAVISGVGVRDYFRKLGYKLRNSYMVKEI